MAEADGQQHPLTAKLIPPRHQHALLTPTWTSGQIDGIQVQRQQLDLSQAPGAERRVASAQLATHLAGRVLREVTEAGFVQQALDIAIGQTADVGTNNQGFERSGPHDAADVRNDATDEAFDTAAYLRHRDADLAFGGLDRLAATAVARTRCRQCALVA